MRSDSAATGPHSGARPSVTCDAWGQASRRAGSLGAEPEAGTVGAVVEAAAEEGGRSDVGLVECDGGVDGEGGEDRPACGAAEQAGDESERPPVALESMLGDVDLSGVGLDETVPESLLPELTGRPIQTTG